jgi:drug/metabolite transporter (DMT)-like permease
MKPGAEPAPGRASIVLGIAVLAISTGSILARFAAAQPLVIAAYRVGLAALLVAPLAAWRAWPELRRLSAGQAKLAIVSGFFLALHFATWISSLSYTSVANSVVLVNTIPIWVAVLTPLLTRDRVTGRTWSSIALSVLGGVLVGLGDWSLGRDALIGDALALAGAGAASAYLLLGRRLRAQLSLLAYVLVCYGSAALLLWSVVLAGRLPVSGFSLGTWGALLGMAVISQHLGHSGYNYALKFFSASAVAVILLGEPLLATLWAYLLLAEQLSWSKACGGVCILAGIYLAACRSGTDHS